MNSKIKSALSLAARLCNSGSLSKTSGEIVSDAGPAIQHTYKLNLHGFDVLLNCGNTYPEILRHHKYFNSPLVELVNQAFQSANRALCFADVGAATGDTVLLLEQRCAGKVKTFTCFEGDDEFEQILRLNMSQFPHVRVIKTLLAAKRGTIRSLVKHHGGSASSTGDRFVEARPLDLFRHEFSEGLDILKVDVDGYDGEVLQGAQGLLVHHQPWVIFEWHPQLIAKAGVNAYAAFDALQTCGYSRFLWFENTGLFSHFSVCPTYAEVAQASEYLIRVNKRRDEHFDVIAIPQSGSQVDVELAIMEYARRAADELPACCNA